MGEKNIRELTGMFFFFLSQWSFVHSRLVQSSLPKQTLKILTGRERARWFADSRITRQSHHQHLKAWKGFTELLRRKRGFLRSTTPRAKTKALSTLFDLLVHVAAVFQAMDGAAQGAAALCVCKAAFSLLFLPSLAACNSPVSFCCCCLLLFTDLLVAGESQDVNASCAGGGSSSATATVFFLSQLWSRVSLYMASVVKSPTILGSKLQCSLSFSGVIQIFLTSAVMSQVEIVGKKKP